MSLNACLRDLKSVFRVFPSIVFMWRCLSEESRFKLEL